MIEPTYLRYVYDKLNQKSLSSDNASNLPYGFVDIYEKQIDIDKSIVLRRDNFTILLYWALFKDSVSILFVSKIYLCNKEVLENFIQKFSNFFNSSEKDKYKLYHERLRIYILQKSSNDEILKANNRIIDFCKTSLKEKNEFEKYALQFLGDHLLLQSELKNEYYEFNLLVRDISFIERQKVVCKNFDWSKNLLKKFTQLNSRLNNFSECIYGMVESLKIWNQEQSNFKIIFNSFYENLLSDSINNINLISDQRKRFHIYLLFIHELTIGKLGDDVSSLDKIPVILNELKKIYLEVGDWSVFYPEELVLEYHMALKKNNFDFLFIWENALAYNFKNDFQDILIKYKSEQQELLRIKEILSSKEINNELSDEVLTCKYYCDLAQTYASKGLKKESLKALSNSLEIWKNNSRIGGITKSKLLYAYSRIYTELDLIDEAVKLAEELVPSIKGGSVQMKQDSIYLEIVKVLLNKQRFEEAVRIESKFQLPSNRNRFYEKLITELLRFDKEKEALKYVSKIDNLWESINIRIINAEILFEKSRNKKALNLIDRAIKLIVEELIPKEKNEGRKIFDSGRLYNKIITVLLKYRYYEIALKLAERTEDLFDYKWALEEICNFLIGDKKINQAVDLIKKNDLNLFNCIDGNKISFKKNIKQDPLFNLIKKEFTKIKEAEFSLLDPDRSENKFKYLLYFTVQNNLMNFFMEFNIEYLKDFEFISYQYNFNIILQDMIQQFFEDGNIIKLNNIKKSKIREEKKAFINQLIWKIYLKKGDMKGSISFLNELSDEELTCKYYCDLAQTYASKGLKKESLKALSNSLEIWKNNSRIGGITKSKLLYAYSRIYTELDLIDEAVKLAEELVPSIKGGSVQMKQDSIYLEIVKVLLNKQRFEEAVRIESKFQLPSNRNRFYEKLITELLRFDKEKEALKYVSKIDNLWESINIRIINAEILFEKSRNKKALNLIDRAIKLIVEELIPKEKNEGRKIFDSGRLYNKIITVLLKYRYYEIALKLAESTLNEKDFGIIIKQIERELVTNGDFEIALKINNKSKYHSYTLDNLNQIKYAKLLKTKNPNINLNTLISFNKLNHIFEKIYLIRDNIFSYTDILFSIALRHYFFSNIDKMDIDKIEEILYLKEIKEIAS